MKEKDPVYRKKVTPYFTRTGSLDPIMPDYPMPSMEGYTPLGSSGHRKTKNTTSSGKFGSTKKITGSRGVKVRWPVPSNLKKKK